MKCENCNKPMPSKRNTKRFCSSTCRQHAFYNRHFSVRNAKNIDAKISVPNANTNTNPVFSNDKTNSDKNMHSEIAPIPNANLDNKEIELLTRILSILDRIVYLMFQPIVSKIDVKAVYKALESISDLAQVKDLPANLACSDLLELLQIDLCRFLVEGGIQLNLPRNVKGQVHALVNKLVEKVKRVPFN